MLAPGATLNDRYVLTSRVGGGGMGEVWRADDTVLGRAVAVKVMTPALAEDPTFAQRFQNEARAMATLRHPGVVDVYDYGACEVGGRRVSFLVMEFVEGESLDRVLRRRPLDPAATMRLVAEVADALSAAHEQGIVHRDVKPANLLIRSDGRVALTDFGIAHSASAGQLTATGAMLCSAGYCAPELATASEVTPSADVYALGVVAFECLAGHLPFQGETPVQIIFKHLHADVPPLPAEVPAGPREVVARALAKEPGRRWPSAVAMGAAARQAMTAPDTPPDVLPGAPLATPSTGAPPARETTSGTGATASAAEPGTLPTPPPAPDPHATAPVSPRRRARSALLAVAAAVAVTSAVAGSIWLRPESAADPVLPVTPSVATSEAAPVAEPPTTAVKQSAPPPRTSTTAPRPSATATATPSASATPTPTPSATEPSTTPTQSPTKEPEPSQEPTGPGPQEPTAEPEPSVTAEPGDIQCVRAPCP
ncbi:protein kinase [Nonomuraea muscovyensis]|uniref:serine/threonine-protein kinase n=1 Tax=Nonomuraea muscovyensis TaxID=1124761 RepID=UPI0033F75522